MFSITLKILLMFLSAKNLTFILLLSFFSFFLNDLKAQNKELVQFSGIIMASDSLQPVALTNIWNISNRRGTSSNFQGFFSFVVRKGDTIQFSAVGYQRGELVVPRNLQESSYSVIQFLQEDTIELPPAIVYPWPSKAEFKQAFLTANVPDDDMRRAQRNLDKERMREIASTMGMDGNENYDYQMRQYSASLYSAGQYPHYRIFDVFAWAEFFKALKRGDFKNKNKNN